MLNPDQTNEAITEAQYIQSELVSEVKREYVNGQVFAMAGASLNHNKITSNINRIFGNHLQDSPCYPCASDLRLKTASGSHRYPDVVVICDDDIVDNATRTPKIIVEVISQSTRKADERDKFLEYINIESLAEYVLIEQDFVSVTVFRRNKDWRPEHHYLGETVYFGAIDLTLNVVDIYNRVDNDEMKAFVGDLGLSR